MNPIFYLLLGVALGFLLGWLWRSWRPPLRDDRLENELREQLRARERDLSNGREALADSDRTASAAQAALAARETAYGELDGRHRQAVADTRQLTEQVIALKKINGELEARARFLDERLKVERQQIEMIQEKFRQEFEAISNKLLAHSSSRFNEQSSESLNNLLAPLKQTMGEFKTSLDDTRKETVTNSALLKEQITRISTEAANLSKALKGDVKVLGNWGENMLDQILEKSGLQEGIHYRRQHSAKDAEGDQRFLDVMVELPDQRHLIVDSKISLRSYEESVNCAEEATRVALQDKHVEAVRKHFHDLGRKRYQDLYGLNAPDFVLMYVPIEAAFFVALARDPGLFAEALDQNVVLITNSTLLATLRTVAHVWRLADQQKHALEIADRGGKLYDKFVGFINDLESVGTALKDGVAAWEKAANKLHTGAGNLVRQAEQLKELGAKATKALPTDLIQNAQNRVNAEL
jgi:DNA recombination protein RmuC